MRKLENLNDNELMEIGHDGKKNEAFTIIYNRYNKNLKNFCLRKTKNEELAKEISQETFLKLYSSWDTYNKRPTNTFKTWLFQIAKNKYIDYIREKNSKKGKVRGECFSDVLREKFYNDENIEQKLFGKYFDEGFGEKEDKKERNYVFMQIIKQKLDHFKPPYFKLLKMHYFDELKYCEIAEKLQIPMGSLKAELFRAKRFVFDEISSRKSFFYD